MGRKYADTIEPTVIEIKLDVAQHLGDDCSEEIIYKYTIIRLIKKKKKSHIKKASFLLLSFFSLVLLLFV